MDADHYMFEPLGNHHRAAFSCGEEQLDRYFRERAGQDQRRAIASCFILFDQIEQTVAGYYTLSAISVLAADFPESFLRRLPRYPSLPGILLARLAVDRRYQGQGLGRRLLVDALRRARDVTSEIGALVVVVDALHEAATRFYESFGFQPFEDIPLRLYLPISDIRDL